MPEVLDQDMQATRSWTGPPGRSQPDLRDIPRAFVRCKVFYTSLSGQGQGTTGNLSRNGCLIEGDVPPKLGDKLTLVLHRPTSPDLIVVDKARVAWTNGRRFGVAHETLYPSELARLNALLSCGQPA